MTRPRPRRVSHGPNCLGQPESRRLPDCGPGVDRREPWWGTACAYQQEARQVTPALGQAVDLDRLFRLRLVVGRVGEMDLAGWWNTKGQLGSLGASVVKRGFQRTHHFAQARSVFAVAARRVNEVYERKDAVTLWGLPADVEDAFDTHWSQWIDRADAWTEFFRNLHSCSSDLVAELRRFDLVAEDQVERASRLRRTAEQRGVQLPGDFAGSDDQITMLALAFSRAERQKLAVPFQTCLGEDR